MKDKLSIIAIILSSISIVFSAMTLSGVLVKDPEDAQKSTQYVMYVGTNDRDSYAPTYSNEEAMEIVDKICLKHFEGYTLQDATGSWTDENGNVTHEYTLVCYFDDADEASVYEAADEAKEALNQSTILIEKDDIITEYYSGN